MLIHPALLLNPSPGKCPMRWGRGCAGCASAWSAFKEPSQHPRVSAGTRPQVCARLPAPSTVQKFRGAFAAARSPNVGCEK